ncbi:MAG: tetratricopeptide repeat protein [Gemmatimonadaceae bacterium]
MSCLISPRGNRRLALAALTSALSLASAPAVAQSFSLKTSLAASGITGCSAVTRPGPATAPTAAAAAEAQQLIADGQDAALQGEHATARDAFSKAAALVPDNARLAYYLGREHEALSDNARAVREYCRYLSLATSAPDGDEVRGRIVRLTPASELTRLEEARANFRSGVALLRSRQYAAADSVFGAVAGSVPNAPEPFFNRALARAARGDREIAMQDFEKYLELSPQSTDRATLRAAMARLPERVYGPGQAFGSGLLVPGLGQMTTGRPVLGVVALGSVAGAVGVALRTKDMVVTETFTDPFGNRYTDSVTQVKRPQLVAGLATAGAVWFLAAVESSSYARRSRSRAAAIIAREPLLPGSRQIGMTIAPLPGDRVGVGISIR